MIVNGELQLSREDLFRMLRAASGVEFDRLRITAVRSVVEINETTEPFMKVTKRPETGQPS